jgi:acetyl-CoA carboxylase carboxyl transferase subunit beta
LIDTKGADPSSDSENAGVAWAIALTMDAMLSHETPIVSVITGEGGSGGALALTTSDVLLAFENSVFSVIGPEAAAAIMWRDGSRAPEAARLLRLTAADLVQLGIADELLPEPIRPDQLSNALAYHLDRLISIDPNELTGNRSDRWRHDGNR